MNICVFCGSGLGENPIYRNTADDLGRQLAKGGHRLVYGGGKVGLMGILADAVLSQQGQVTGVIPDFLLQRETGHEGVTRLEVVSSMHVRKKRMADLSDAFVAMPGGWGTLDELAEILTWRQLGLITKPIFVLNTNDFFDPLLTQMKRMEEDGFLRAGSLSVIQVKKSVSELIASL